MTVPDFVYEDELDPWNNHALDPWDQVTLDDNKGSFFALPGVAKVSPEFEVGVDIRATPMAEGATYNPTGNQPATVTIDLTIWTPDQWKALSTVWGLIRPPAKRGVKPTAFACYHPALKMVGVDTIIFVKMSGPTISEPGGPVTFRLTARQYLPLKPIAGGPIDNDTYNQGNFAPLARPGGAPTQALNPAPGSIGTVPAPK